MYVYMKNEKINRKLIKSVGGGIMSNAVGRPRISSIRKIYVTKGKKNLKKIIILKK